MIWAILFWTAGVLELFWSVYLLGCSENVSAAEPRVFDMIPNTTARTIATEFVPEHRLRLDVSAVSSTT